MIIFIGNIYCFIRIIIQMFMCNSPIEICLTQIFIWMYHYEKNHTSSLLAASRCSGLISCDKNQGQSHHRNLLATQQRAVNANTLRRAVSAFFPSFLFSPALFPHPLVLYKRLASSVDCLHVSIILPTRSSHWFNAKLRRHTWLRPIPYLDKVLAYLTGEAPEWFAS